MLKIPGRSLLAALAELAALGLEVGPEFRPGRVPQQQSSPAQPSRSLFPAVGKEKPTEYTSTPFFRITRHLKQQWLTASASESSEKAKSKSKRTFKGHLRSS